MSLAKIVTGIFSGSLALLSYGIDSATDVVISLVMILTYNRIFEAVDKVPEAHNVQRARIRTIGNLYMIALDIKVDGNISLNEAHNIAHDVEPQNIQTVENIYDIVVHVESLGQDHPEEKFGIDRKL